MTDQPPPKPAFADIAHKTRPSLLRDIFGLLKANKKWWLLPIIAMLLLLGVLVLLSGTAVAPFIYTLF
jgi:hypothetical protein